MALEARSGFTWQRKTLKLSQVSECPGSHLTSAWIKLEFISGSKALLSYTDRLCLDCEPWGYKEDFPCVGFKTAHEPTVLSTDYLKGTRENIKLIEIIRG